MNAINIHPLIELITVLRDKDNGCPWDLQQTHETLIGMTFEELSELADAIARGDTQNTCEELGDVLFHLVFYARIAEENGDFCMQDVIDGTVKKMTQRHPHIFAGKVYSNAAEQKADWEHIKAEEKTGKTFPYPILDDKQKLDSLPAIMQSIAMQKNLAELGLYGDLLFAVLNLGRKLDINPDMALRKANHKFYTRSESMITEAGSVESFVDLTMSEKEILWKKIKQLEENKTIKKIIILN